MDVCWIKPINAYRTRFSGRTSWQHGVHRDALIGFLFIILVTDGKRARFGSQSAAQALHKYRFKWWAIKSPNCATTQWYHLHMTAWASCLLVITSILSQKLREYQSFSLNSSWESYRFIQRALFCFASYSNETEDTFAWFCIIRSSQTPVKTAMYTPMLPVYLGNSKMTCLLLISYSV